jgi:hypothetical protein
VSDELRLSRVAKTVATLSEGADTHRFATKKLLLTGDVDQLVTDNGREALLFALRLLVRISREVDVLVPAGLPDLTGEARELIGEIGLGGRALDPDDQRDHAYAAVLSVGTRAERQFPWTVINSNGWLARVSSGATSLSGECSQRNPIGARVAACLGVAEVFKRLAGVRPERGPLLDGLLFSAFTYRSGDADPGPALPESIALPTFLLAGCGAIGNGIVELLYALRTSGRGVLVDRQCFREENLGTCALMRVGDIGSSKAGVLAEWLRAGGLDVVGLKSTIADIAPRLGHGLRFPEVVLGGLDRIEPRHELQRLWPDVYLDGAISPFGCQVTRHPWGEDVGCALDVFRIPLVSSDAVAMKMTGLPLERLHDPEALVEQHDVNAAATEEQKAWLRARLGQPICSVVPAAVLAAISTEDHADNFEPSVPFVACLSAAFVVGELVKLATGSASVLGPRFQMDVLQGPQRGALFDEGRGARCECVTRAKNIERVRAARKSS